MIRKLLPVIGLLISLQSCGFKLKQDGISADQAGQIHITGSELYHNMSRTLRDYLNDRGVLVSDTPTDNQITITKESLERRLLSLLSNGQVAEYDLVFVVQYAIKHGDNDAEVFEYKEIRQYQDDPDNALAKYKEREVIVAEMRLKACTAITRKYVNTIPKSL